MTLAASMASLICMTTKTNKPATRNELVRGWITAHHDAEEAARRQREEDRAAIEVLATYSPRRQWTTRQGAIFVERLGFIRRAGD